jgi:hypothetical protein
VIVEHDCRVVNQSVNAAPGLHGGVDDLLRAFLGRDTRTAGHRLTPRRDDVVGHRLGHRRVGAPAARAAAQIVDDDAGTALCELDGLALADPAGSTGDDDDVAVDRISPLTPVSSLKMWS